MTDEQLIWLIVAIVAVLAVLGLLAWMAKRRKAQQLEQDRIRAQEIRHEAATKTTDVRDSSLQAREAELQAERARLEAEKAERRAAEAQQGAAVEEAQYEDRLREADRVDPDVNVRADDYTPAAPVPDDGITTHTTSTTTGTHAPDSTGSGSHSAGRAPAFDSETGERIDPQTGRPSDPTLGADDDRRDDLTR